VAVKPKKFARLQVLEQGAVRTRGCVVKLVDNHDVEMIRCQPIEPGC
jgi:hypothetical protein